MFQWSEGATKADVEFARGMEIELHKAIDAAAFSTFHARDLTLRAEHAEAVVRDLMITIERLRSIAEYSKFSAQTETTMHIATTKLDQHKAMLADYQTDSYWSDVRKASEA
jgi:hypothetical protein